MRAIGVDVGGHKVAAALVEDGRILRRIEEPTAAPLTPAVVAPQIGRIVAALGSGAVDNGAFGPLDWVLVALVPVAMAGVALLTARRTVLSRPARGPGPGRRGPTRSGWSG